MTPFIKLQLFIGRMLILSALSVNVAHCDEAGQSSGHFDYYDQDPAAHKLLGYVEEYHLNQGIAAMNKGGLSHALGHFDFILNRFPNHPRVLLLVSEVFHRMKTPAKADLYFQKAIQLYPETAPTYAAYGIFLHKSGQLGLAIENYKTSLKLDPGSMSTHYNLGLAYFDKKQFDLANQHAGEAYAQGFPLPGLRDKLKKAGAWKPTEQSATTAETVPQ